MTLLELEEQDLEVEQEDKSKLKYIIQVPRQVMIYPFPTEVFQ
jgi:hypothetical protein